MHNFLNSHLGIGEYGERNNRSMVVRNVKSVIMLAWRYSALSRTKILSEISYGQEIRISRMLMHRIFQSPLLKACHLLSLHPRIHWCLFCSIPAALLDLYSPEDTMSLSLFRAGRNGIHPRKQETCLQEEDLCFFIRSFWHHRPLISHAWVSSTGN